MARILLADDDPASRELVQRALAADGHAVEAHTDGGEALESILAAGAGEPPALLITDAEMPVLDGIALTKKVLAARAGLRVLLISGFADAIERARAMGEPRVSTLMKPFSLEQMRAAVRAALAR